MSQDDNDYARSLDPVGPEPNFEKLVEIAKQLEQNFELLPPIEIKDEPGHRIATWRERPDLMLQYGGLIPAQGVLLNPTIPFGLY